MAKRSARKFLALLLSLMMIATVFVVPAVSAAEQLSVTFHYQRTDGNYTDWNLWIWPENGDGSQQDFTSEDSFGKVAQFNVDVTGVDKVGFIVRKSTSADQWAGKDTNADRYFLTSKAVDGKIDIRLISVIPRQS